MSPSGIYNPLLSDEGKAFACRICDEQTMRSYRANTQQGEESEEGVQRLVALEHDARTEIVIHVNRLKKNWDVTNLVRSCRFGPRRRTSRPNNA
jgi:hypothetical protein